MMKTGINTIAEKKSEKGEEGQNKKSYENEGIHSNLKKNLERTGPKPLQ